MFALHARNYSVKKAHGGNRMLVIGLTNTKRSVRLLVYIFMAS